ncbi:MAG TPA: metallophosphoesterase [Actinomycetes bacterium]|jgi:predicted phosphodiesterase|nr:metallophosphoesterase [Actinomycetes bacterium]
MAGVLGALLAIGFLARLDARVGPATLRLSARPAVEGSSRLAVPPFGSVSAHTHFGPLAFRATLDDVDVQALGHLIDQSPSSVADEGLAATLHPLEVQARHAALLFVLRIAALGLLGGAAAVLLFPRRTWIRLGRCAAGGVLATVLLLVPSLATFDISAFRAPRYQGALEYAPTLIGDVRTGLKRLRTLREQMALISQNLNRAYTALSQPSPDLGSGTVRILHISDVHLNPAGFDLAQRLARQFEVAAVVDTGDLGTWGLSFEPGIAARIKEFDVPYLFVKGNHDSPDVVSAVAANRNARVLDWSSTRVAGIRFFGVGDPTFSPGSGYRTDEFETLKDGRSVEVGAAIDAQAPPADVLLVHDPHLATYALGHIPTVMDGHFHEFRTDVTNGTRELTTGTVGGAGPDGLRARQPVPYGAEVLYFDTQTRRPIGVDRIAVHSLESAFSVDRELLPEGQGAFSYDPVTVPTTTTTTLQPGPAGTQAPQVLPQAPRGRGGVGLDRPDPTVSRSTTP